MPKTPQHDLSSEPLKEDLVFDPWVQLNSPLAPDKLHAIGVIAFRWNKCEFGLLVLLADIVGMPRNEVWAMVHDLRDNAICQRVRTFTAFRVLGAGVKALIENCYGSTTVAELPEHGDPCLDGIGLSISRPPACAQKQAPARC